MKIISLLLLAVISVGCGAFDRLKTRYTGELTYKCSRIGVEYVQSDSGLAVSLDQNGNPVKCNP